MVQSVFVFIVSVVLRNSFCPRRDRAKCWSLGWFLVPTLQHKIIPAARKNMITANNKPDSNLRESSFHFKTKVIQTHKAREKEYERVRTDFGFTSDWMKKGREVV